MIPFSTQVPSSLDSMFPKHYTSSSLLDPKEIDSPTVAISFSWEPTTEMVRIVRPLEEADGFFISSSNNNHVFFQPGSFVEIQCLIADPSKQEVIHAPFLIQTSTNPASNSLFFSLKNLSLYSLQLQQGDTMAVSGASYFFIQ